MNIVHHLSWFSSWIYKIFLLGCFFSNALPVANLMILALAWVLLAEKSIVLALRASIAESKPKFTKDANCLRPGLPRKCGNLWFGLNIPLFHHFFSERIPPIHLRFPGVDQIHRKGRRAPAEVEEIIRFTQQCQIMFSRNPTGPCVPWTLVYYDFCSMFPRSSLVTQYPTLHRAVCAFRSLFAQVLKCSGCMIITVPKCTHFKPLGLGKVAGFFGSFCPRAEGACWCGILTRSWGWLFP